MLVAFLVGGTQIDAIDNPPPCTDPWVCDYSPVIGGTISGPASPCHGESVTYTIAETKTAGQRSHCKITEAVNVTSISWTWTVTGPEGTPSKSGSGKTFADTFNQAGDYTITFIGEADVSSLTCYYNNVTVTKQVTVAGDSGEATLSDAQECPGGTAVLTWKITNTGHCSAIFSYIAHELEGDLKVTLTPTFGSITLAAGASGTGTLQVAIAADSTTGDKKIGMEFSTGVTSGVAYPRGHVKVPPHKAKAFISSLPDCPMPDVGVLFAIENTGCKGT